MKKKSYKAPLSLDEAKIGSFAAVFAKLNVIDHDGDVTIPGAFRDGQAVYVEGWNHDPRPAGKGVIHADDEKAWVEGEFFLDTAHGKETYLTVKNLGGIEEWSYTFVVEDESPGEFEGQQANYLKSLDTIGVSPVTRGAGIDTQTMAIKAHKTEGEARERKPSGEAEVLRAKIQLKDYED